MGARVMAVLAAVAMVVGAIVVRARIDSGDNNAPLTGRGALKLLCASELASACEQLRGADVEVTIEPAAVTADRLRSLEANDASFDGWVAPGPWRDVVDATPSIGQRSALRFRLGPRGSPLMLAVWKDKRVSLNCPEPLDLGCVGDAVNSRGFRLGVASDDEAVGVLADAALGVGHADNADFATNDLRETDLAEWLTGIDERADRVGMNPGGRSFTELLTFGAANADGYLSTEADIGPQLVQASRRNDIEALYVRPVATADVTFNARVGSRGDRLRALMRGERVRQLLNATGWRVEGRAPAAGVGSTPRLVDDDGLPSGGVLSALMEVTR